MARKIMTGHGTFTEKTGGYPGRMRIVVIGGEVFIAASDAKAMVDSTTEEERLMHPVWQLHHLHDYIVGGEENRRSKLIGIGGPTQSICRRSLPS